MSISLPTRAEAEKLLRERRAKQRLREKYYNDPASFVSDCFNWEGGDGPTAYQCEVLQALVDHRRVTVRGPHGLGKTALCAWIILWFAITRDAAGEDWKIPSTASAWRQLSKFLWPEIRKWARRMNWHVLGRKPFNEMTELLSLALKLKYGEAFALVSDNPAQIEGAHAANLLYLFDESKTIREETWDAAEGAFSTGHCYFVAVSTPGEPSGRFYEIHSRRPGYDDWWARHVTVAECIAAGRVEPSWIENRARQWGKESAVFQNRCLGEFASSAADTVIPLAWVEAANRRWEDLDGTFDLVTHVGVDVARGGGDQTVLAVRSGDAIQYLTRHVYADTMVTAGLTKAVLDKHPGALGVIDVIGLGAGVYDRLREQEVSVMAFNAAEKTDAKDRSGELGFINRRAEAWWRMREALDPANDQEICLPPDDLLTGDLTAPHWSINSNGKIAIESKDKIRERLGRSPDSADAVIQAFYGYGICGASDWLAAYEREAAVLANDATLLPEAGTWDKPAHMG